jgi:uncharacterized protein involved in exopolysaccharide biosynthesis
MFKRFWWVFLVMLPVGAMVGLLVAAVVTYVMPKLYESEAVVQTMPSGRGMPEDGAEFSRAGTVAPQFFATEFEVIKSRKSLEKIVAKLELVTRWNVDKETAIRIVKGLVNTENIRGTDLISIRVRHTNKVDARDIAGEVAHAYKEYRAEIEGRESEARLEELNKAVRDQEDKVEERRKALAEIELTQKKNLKINGNTTLLHLSPSQDYIDAKREFETDQELLQTMKLKQIGETISRKIPGNSVQIHEEPVIADSPVSPNVTLNLVLGTALGLLLSPLLALPVMWLLDRLKPAKA